MSETQTLRIGVCECADSFHGKFEGLVVSVRQLKDVAFAEPLSFKLAEVIIPEKGDQRRALRQRRPHFFFDAHPDRISLCGIELVPRKTGQDYLYIRGVTRMLSEWWPGFYALEVGEVCRAIERMLGQLTEAKFQRWLTVMDARR